MLHRVRERDDGTRTNPVIGVVMGSASDWSTMQRAVEVLTEFGVPHEAKVVSAHRIKRPASKSWTIFC